MSLTDDTALDAADATPLEPLPLAPAPVGPSLLLRAGAEVFGTFILVLLGVGATIYPALVVSGISTLVSIIGFGAGLTIAIATVGHISGGHFNPAVTLGTAIAGRTRWADLPVYWLAQVVGATLAAITLFAIVPSTVTEAIGATEGARSVLALGANGFDTHSTFTTPILTGLIVEVILTLAFVGLVLSATAKPRASAATPAFIGLALAVTLLVAAPFTGGSVNPARSLGVAFFAESWALKQSWLFVVGPLLGAAIAGLVARVLSLGGSPAVLEGAFYAGEPGEFAESVVIDEDGELQTAAVAEETNSEQVTDEIDAVNSNRA
ncbi:aquaporin [Flavimobilis sp. GY10621]|uniref:Aquaporin n=1 Tax=Flavimobilis rhizosphaerae TaxID=2775421 RepID=A0ABR9DP62_9MICO|nr:aquaporin [Flavimobilis rhizosphaerae]MBD9698903.1 aquaporin [Flavimobilis rhizosphaerae]